MTLRLKNSGIHLVRHQTQLKALIAAARQEVIDVLSQMGTVSVSELAAAMNRPPDALYFHLRALLRAGLVRRVRFRSSGRKKDALYRTAAPELRLAYEPTKRGNRKALSRIVASMLRLGIRDFTGALKAGNAVVSGRYRELWALRKTGWLSLAEIGNVNRSISKLTGQFSAHGRGGRLYAITILITPLDHRNKRGKPAKSKKAKK
jgi:DNA-binding transcriptional ArsR family regulator